MRVCQFRHFGTESCGAGAPYWAAIPSVTNACACVKPPPSPAAFAPSFCRRGILAMDSHLPMTSTPGPRPIPEEQAKEIRRLSHDLSNALEIVLQTSFLLGMVPLDEDAQKWRSMLDGGVQQAADINRRLREYIRTNS